MRDPFWPIGYQRPVEAVAGPVIPSGPGEPEPQAEPDRKWDQAQRAISIKGIIKSGNRYLANINNQLVAENEIIAVMYEGQKYNWKVTSITAKKVLFKPTEEEPPAKPGAPPRADTMMGP